MNKQKITFEDFISFFPELEPPITLTEESSLEFSKHNKPLPAAAIHEFILPYETQADELTEFLPCFKIPETNTFHAVVYWKAGLLSYEYKMITFDQSGNFIDGKVIAGTISNGESIIRTVSTIDTDWIIHSVVGEQNATKSTKINTESKSFSLELLGTGEIIFSLNEKIQ